MLSEEQIFNIKLRRLATIREFLSDMTLSDESLAEILMSNGIKTSSSTVGRDLTTCEIIPLLSEIDPRSNPNDLFNAIQNARKLNKENGYSKGGNNFALNNCATKDEKGKFTGSISR